MAPAGISANEMRAKMLPLDTYRERLATTEPISTVPFETHGAQTNTATLSMDADWSANLDNLGDTDEIPVTIRVGRREHPMSKSAVLTLASDAKLQGALLKNTPARLIEPIINWKLQNGPERAGERQLMVHNDRVVAITKPSIVPFSNVRLLDSVAEGLQDKFGPDLLVDYKSAHSLRNSTARIVVPDALREPRDNDPWSIGIELANSLTGEHATELSGYAFRWWCTNGCTTDHGSGKWNRRASSQNPDDVYAWAKDQIDGILEGLDEEFEKLSEAANTPLNGEVNDVMRDAFSRYEVPLAAREGIISNMVDSDDLTLYGLQAAITQAANDPDRTPAQVSTLLRAGGGLIHDTERCDSCHRAM
jgi:hypothetical protein